MGGSDGGRATAPLRFAELTPATWPAFEALFRAPGGPSFCWCMVWRASPKELGGADGATRREAMAARVAAGETVGILGFDGEEPVVWCSIAPRESLPRLAAARSADRGVWTIACLHVRRSHRGRGLTAAANAAAVDFARERGAAHVEAHPVEWDARSHRFLGFVSTFERAGFTRIERAGTRRSVYRLVLEGDGAGAE
ncbi:GNAT family N-acetyltransferase [Siculibacillus lacustris]|uniref:GNAT family N-acetyltransferase n=1 Tax=Siculibacillus lacustris TaxID=1549641 RepID=A0A4V2KU90_9HYPH|nr:GNAT family N-acetyltransferase [Siculibacillus lacustris]TBW40345.1 GNAT family N-acetyltransferase [Siculibacillus lacustris]